MKGLLKFITCGSVDDGKSTLIGHILYDAKLLYADQEKALELDSKVGGSPRHEIPGSGRKDYNGHRRNAPSGIAPAQGPHRAGTNRPHLV